MGRSNVGKSSLINMLLSRRQLAKTSSRPGKTQLINHFLINDAWHLVDLPGYGWAQVGKVERKRWGKMVKDYLLQRKQLSCVLVLVDARHTPQKLDLDQIRWLGTHHIPFIILLTKADKVAKHLVQKHLARLEHTLHSDWEVLPQMLVTSSKNGTGREVLLHYIQQALGKHSV